MTRTIVSVLAALLAVIAPALAQSSSTAASQPASAPTRAEQLRSYVELIQKTNSASEAMAAYAKGCTADSRSQDLNQAYMRRMLKFGLPQIAVIPAKTLVHIDPENGMAWGLIGYVEGKQGNYTEALIATVRAVVNLKNDPGVLNNAGQLIAWYETVVDLPNLPDRTKRALAQIKEEISATEPFKQAYQNVKAAIAEREVLAKDYNQKLAAAAAEVKLVQEKAGEVESRIRDLNDQIDAHNRNIDDLRRNLLYTPLAPYGLGLYGRAYYEPNLWRREQIRTQIRNEESTIDTLRGEIARLRQQNRPILELLEAKRAELEKLQKLNKAVLDRLYKRLRWDPPAVDGVIVNEADRFPAATQPVNVPEDVESKAARQLMLAQAYIINDMPEKAVPILNEVLTKYASTEAAKKAREMLKKIPLDPP